jgi:hypothetical protein
MTLVAATPRLIVSDLAGRETFAEAIHAKVPENWPPPLYGSAVMNTALEQLEDPAEHGWSIWYLLSRKDDAPCLLGICDFKGMLGAVSRTGICHRSCCAPHRLGVQPPECG